jgi:type II secretory pathway component PulF
LRKPLADAVAAKRNLTFVAAQKEAAMVLMWIVTTIVACLCLIYGGLLFAFFYYRHIRREEVRHVLAAAAETAMPLETALRAYVEDRPSQPREVIVGTLLFFVIPGYYWFWYRRYSFDTRLEMLADRLEAGSSLRDALRGAGVASPETAMAAAVGQASGRLGEALSRGRPHGADPLWLVVFPRLLYPVMIVLFMLAVLGFITTFIMPKIEKIFFDFKLRLPETTAVLIGTTRFARDNLPPILGAVLGVVLLIVFAAFSSKVCWHFPVLGRLYRMNAQARLLKGLGMLLEARTPLPAALELLNDRELLPRVLCERIGRLSKDVELGQSLAESMRRHGLLPAAMAPLVHSAERARNLPWALTELGEHLARRLARLVHRWSLILFPITVLLVACVVGFVASAMFLPLVHIIEGVAQW